MTAAATPPSHPPAAAAGQLAAIERARDLALRGSLTGRHPDETFREILKQVPELFPAEARAVALGWTYHEVHRRFRRLAQDRRVNPEGLSVEGVTPYRVGQWLRGEHRPTDLHLRLLCLVLGLPRRVLFPGPDDQADAQVEALRAALGGHAGQGGPAGAGQAAAQLARAEEGMLPDLSLAVPLGTYEPQARNAAWQASDRSAGILESTDGAGPLGTQREEEVDAMRRREFNQALLAVGGGLTLDGLAPTLAQEALERADRAERTEVSGGTVAELEGLADQLGARYLATSPLAALGTAWGYLRHVDALLERRLTVAYRRRLLAVAGRLTYLAGRALGEVGALAAGEHHARAAYRLARQAGDHDLAARCLESLAAHASRQGAFRRALGYATLGQQLAPQGGVSTVWLPNWEAAARALAGDPGALEALQRAERNLERATPVTDRGVWGFFPADHYVFAAFVHARLGDGRRGEEHARLAIAQWAGVSAMHEASARVDLGHSLLAQRQPEQAAGEGLAALDLYQRRPSRYVLGKVAGLDAALRAGYAGVRAVQDLHERLQELRQGLPAA